MDTPEDVKVFPWHFKNAMMIGFNIDEEPVAVCNYNYTPFLIRYSKEYKEWLTVRPANEEELVKYDKECCSELGIVAYDTGKRRY